jgi:hypothetical protein
MRHFAKVVTAILFVSFPLSASAQNTPARLAGVGAALGAASSQSANTPSSVPAGGGRSWNALWVAIWAKDEPTAQPQAQAKATNYTVTQISAADYCSPSICDQ